MWFFGRVTNIATWVLIRDAIRADMREYVQRQARKENEKAAKKLKEKLEKEKQKRAKQIKEESYYQNILAEENKWREDFDKKAREWEIQHRIDYEQKLFEVAHLTIEKVEKCEIKEWIKAEIEWLEYPEAKLKYNDDWKIELDKNSLSFSWSVKETTLKNSDIKSHQIYKNWILIVKNRWKNIFFKVDSDDYDTNKFSDLMHWVVQYVNENEWDDELIIRIAEYLKKNMDKKWDLDLLDMADNVWSNVLDCARLTKKLESMWAITFYSDDWNKTKTIDDVRKERAWDLIPTHVKIWNLFLKVLKWIAIIIWCLFWFIILLAIISSMIWNS